MNLENVDKVVEATGVVTKESLTAGILAKKETLEELVIMGSISIGQDLKELKELVPHGEWYSYVENNIGFSKRKVSNLISLADNYGDENSPFGKLISNRHARADLSYSNALALLSLDENDVEEFTENVEIEDVTLKELKEKIKEFEEEKKQAEKIEKSQQAIIEDWEKDWKNLKSEADATIAVNEEKIRELEKEKQKLKEEINSNSDAEETEKLKAEIDKLKAKEKEFEKTIEETKKSTSKAIADLDSKMEEAVSKAKEEARAKAKEEAEALAKAELEELQNEIKKLNAMNDPILSEFRFIMEQAQKSLRDAASKIKEHEDKEITLKMQGAMKQILKGYM